MIWVIKKKNIIIDNNNLKSNSADFNQLYSSLCKWTMFTLSPCYLHQDIHVYLPAKVLSPVAANSLMGSTLTCSAIALWVTQIRPRLVVLSQSCPPLSPNLLPLLYSTVLNQGKNTQNKKNKKSIKLSTFDNSRAFVKTTCCTSMFFF